MSATITIGRSCPVVRRRIWQATEVARSRVMSLPAMMTLLGVVTVFGRALARRSAIGDSRSCGVASGHGAAELSDDSCSA